MDHNKNTVIIRTSTTMYVVIHLPGLECPSFSKSGRGSAESAAICIQRTNNASYF